jgi:hypothetical protein
VNMASNTRILQAQVTLTAPEGIVLHKSSLSGHTGGYLPFPLTASSHPRGSRGIPRPDGTNIHGSCAGQTAAAPPIDFGLVRALVLHTP